MNTGGALFDYYYFYLDTFFTPTFNRTSSILYNFVNPGIGIVNCSYTGWIINADEQTNYVNEIFAIDNLKNSSSFGRYNLSYSKGLAINEKYFLVVENNAIKKFSRGYGVWEPQLTQVDEVTGSKTRRTNYTYDGYGNMTCEFRCNEINSGPTYTTYHTFFPNTTMNILDKEARTRVYNGYFTIDNGDNSAIGFERDFYYDGNASCLWSPPSIGNLTRTDTRKNSSSNISTYNNYDSHGNRVSEQDANGNITTWTYDANGIYPLTKTYPKRAVDYTIQSGDYLQYDIKWSSTTDFSGFDYTCADGATLRDSGAMDQNNITAHPNANLSSRANNTWYSRKNRSSGRAYRQDYLEF